MKLQYLLIFITFIYPMAAYAEDLFVFVSKDQIDQVQADQRSLMEQSRQERTTKSFSIIRINLDQLKQASVNLNLRTGVQVRADVKKIEKRTDADYTWYGTLPDVPGDAILVVQDGNVSGTIRRGNELYRIRPLGAGLHALIEVDQSQFPPEEQPSLRDIEKRSTPTRPEQIEKRQDTRGDVTPVIDVLVAYTQSARTAYGDIGGLIQLAIDETNQSYQNSGINARLRLVHTYEVSYAEASHNYETIVGHFGDDGDGFMDEVHGRRNQYGADAAVLIINQPGACGRAFTIGATEQSAFAVVRYDCATGNYSFGHEIGHLQGAKHHPDDDPSTTPYAYGHGYKHCSQWRTVMAYDCDEDGSTCPQPQKSCPRLQYWSNPDITYDGVAMGTVATHNNARVLNETAATVAAFRAFISDWGCWTTDGGKCSWDSAKWGDSDHISLVGDVNGDGKADRILYRAGDGNWGCWITDGEKCSWDSAKWGSANYVPLVGNVNGDGKADRILYQASQ